MSKNPTHRQVNARLATCPECEEVAGQGLRCDACAQLRAVLNRPPERAESNVPRGKLRDAAEVQPEVYASGNWLWIIGMFKKEIPPGVPWEACSFPTLKSQVRALKRRRKMAKKHPLEPDEARQLNEEWMEFVCLANDMVLEAWTVWGEALEGLPGGAAWRCFWTHVKADDSLVAAAEAASRFMIDTDLKVMALVVKRAVDNLRKDWEAAAEAHKETRSLSDPEIIYAPGRNVSDLRSTRSYRERASPRGERSWLMRHVLSRPDYEDLMVLHFMEDAIEEERSKILADEYPKSNSQVTSELSVRGLRGKPEQLLQLIVDDRIQAPARGADGELAWDRKDVDAAAAELAADDSWTPRGWTWVNLNIHPGQAIRALREAMRQNHKNDATDFEMRILPFAHMAEPESPFSRVVYAFNGPDIEKRNKLLIARLADKLNPRKV